MIKGFFFLMLLVLLHEFGHFIIARCCKVKVIEFSVGFGPAILKKQGKETLYSLRLIPLGGYCSLDGESDINDDPKSFRNISAWKKILILIAGPAMNFLVGIVLILIIMLFSPAMENVYGARLETGSIQATDEIIRVDDFHIFTTNDILYAESFNNGPTHDVVILRDGERIELNDYTPVGGSLVYEGKIKIVEDSISSKCTYAIKNTVSMCQNVALSIKHLCLGDFKLSEVSGPIGIAQEFNKETNKYGTMSLIAFISINLAIMNLIPLPALDGGQILLLLLEKLTRKKFNEEKIGMLNFGCLIVLIGLIIFVSFHDVLKLF